MNQPDFSLHSLQTILQPREPSCTVAFDRNTVYTQHSLLHAVAALHATLQQRHEIRWLLVHDNSYAFAIGLLALWAADKEVILPPNAQAGTLTELAPYADALLGDTSSGNAGFTLPTLPIDIQTSENGMPTLPLLDLDTLNITLFTSGSTGTASAIRKTLRSLEAEIRVLESLWGKLLGQATVLATVSHQHIYGLLFRLLWPLCAGRPFASYTHQYPEPLLADVFQHARSVIVSSPSQLKRLPPSLDLTTARSHIAAVFSSGGPLPFEAAQLWSNALQQTPIEVLGSTETGGVAWRCQASPDTLWQALPSVVLTTDAEQQLQVSSPFIGLDIADSTTPFVMGDRAQIQANGQFQLLGRADRVVKVEEKRLSLTDMEQRLQASPLIQEARVLLLPHMAGRLGVVATLTEQGLHLIETHGKRALTNVLREQLLQHFERVLLPRKWRFPAQLPTDAQGKTPLTALAALFVPSPPMTITVIEHSAECRVLSIHFPESSSLFDGHFPGLPILPGVVQFDIAARQCSEWYPLTAFRRIDKLKFQEPIVPGDTVTLTLQNTGNGQAQFHYTLDIKPLSSGKIVFDC
jgi:acyl-CoA synthetase (AMP-forming)/AMP-acid ligase II/3-hydroxymyristoyl/3-hydroxydecanoyl-(acyl carrier protein) dehydratase